MCRIADGPLGPGELEVTQAAAPLVSWSVSTRDGSEAWDLQGKDLAVELRFPDNTVWTGEAYPVASIESDRQVPGQPLEQEFPLKVQLRGIGALSENSIPVHADVVVKRIDAMLTNSQR
ncbi:MAG: hypothetical protein DLM60_02575 [Pseudonocardiales bacterium]|nr:MAG: hypothetical protein DLM60_02575 [Pseudonocardiales bacterium]